MKPIAKAGYLVLYDTGDGKGITQNQKTGKISISMTVQAILARGYWEPLTEEELKNLKPPK